MIVTINPLNKHFNETSILLSNAGYKTVKELWLFANGRHERTLIAYKE